MRLRRDVHRTGLRAERHQRARCAVGRRIGAVRARARRPALERGGHRVLAGRIRGLPAVLPRVVAQRLEQLRAFAEQPNQLVTVQLPAARLRARVGRQQHALRRPKRRRRVGTQLHALAAVVPVAVLARLRQISEIELRMRVLARQLRADLVRRVVETQLVVPLPTNLLRLDARQVAVARQPARVAERRRRMRAVTEHADDHQPVRIAAETPEKDFHADSRQKRCAEIGAGEARRHADRRAVARVAVGARALRVRVIRRIEAVHPHAHPAVFVAEHFFALRADNRAREQMRGRQIGLRIVRGRKRHAAAHARERVLVAGIRVVRQRGRQRAGRAREIAARGEQRVHALVEPLRQVVPDVVIDRRDHELTLVGALPVPLRIARQRDPCAHGEIPHAADAVMALGFELVREHARAGEPLVIAP
ncbi:Uncharacterised protein [Burkholderia pseudomallei]|nr:Uncharacterised protein [Burkholderia pseudomallei]